jgi:hypothetical protein
VRPGGRHSLHTLEQVAHLVQVLLRQPMRS